MSGDLSDVIASVERSASSAEALVRQSLAKVDDPRSVVLISAATFRLREAALLFREVAGDRATVHPDLSALSASIARATSYLTELIAERSSLAREVTIDELEDVLVRQEYATETLAHAEMSANLALAHMTAALELVSSKDSTIGSGDN